MSRMENSYKPASGEAPAAEKSYATIKMMIMSLPQEVIGGALDELWTIGGIDFAEEDIVVSAVLKQVAPNLEGLCHDEQVLEKTREIIREMLPKKKSDAARAKETAQPSIIDRKNPDQFRNNAEMQSGALRNAKSSEMPAGRDKDKDEDKDEV